jgi:myosin heavy subunit
MRYDMVRSVLDLSDSSDSDGDATVGEPPKTVKLGHGGSGTDKDGGRLRKPVSEEIITKRVAVLHANREKAIQARREKAEITRKEKELVKQEKSLAETERVLKLKQKEKDLRKKTRQLKRAVESSSDDSSSSEDEQQVLRVHQKARRVVSQEQDAMVQAHYRQEVERLSHDAIRRVLFSSGG